MGTSSTDSSQSDPSWNQTWHRLTDTMSYKKICVVLSQAARHPTGNESYLSFRLQCFSAYLSILPMPI